MDKAINMELNIMNKLKGSVVFIKGIVNIPFKTFTASPHSLALKKTQAMLIKLKVINQATIFGIVKPIDFQNLCITNAIPCKKPQKTNVHPAPCQIPPMIKVAKRLVYVLNEPFLLPPSGI